MGNSTLPLGGGDSRRISEIILQTAHGFSVGGAVRSDPANAGEYVLAKADSAAGAESVGIIQSVSIDSFELIYQGRIDISGFTYTDTPFLLVAEVWFLSDSVAGELTRTPPSSPGSVIKTMLVVTDPAAEGIVTGFIGIQIGTNIIDLGEIQPVGVIQPWAAPATTTVPTGWALCDGQTLSETTFADLFAVISTDYNDGFEPPGEFRVPDFRGRFAIGQEPSGDVRFDVVGKDGGETDHILTIPELPAHQITLGLNLVTFSGGVNPALVPLGQGNQPDTVQGFTPDTTAPGPPFPSVTGLPHNNLPPFLTINFIIRTIKQASAALVDHGIGNHSDVDPDVSPIGLPSDPNNCDILKFNSTPDLPDFPNGKWEAAPVPSSGAPGTAVLSFRNKIINGQFPFWQRGTSFTSFGAYTSDRWFVGGNLDGGSNTTNVNQQTFALGQTDVPGFPRHYLDVQNFVTGGAGNESAIITQRIERVRTFNGSQITVSFWAMADTPGPHTIAISLSQFFGTGGAPSASVFVAGQEITTLTNTFQYFTLTFTIPSILAKTLGTNNDDNLRLRFFTQAGATVVASDNLVGTVNFTDTLSLANVQVEQGATATAFEIRELETELAFCQRYFAKSYNQLVVPGTGTFGSPERQGELTYTGHAADGNAVNIRFPQTMRSNPTLVIFGIGGLVGVPNAFPATAPEFFDFGATILTIGESGATLVPGAATLGGRGAEFGFHYTSDSEL